VDNMGALFAPHLNLLGSREKEKRRVSKRQPLTLA